MNTVLPSVTSLKFSVVSSIADADDAAATRASKIDACLLIVMMEGLRSWRRRINVGSAL